MIVQCDKCETKFRIADDKVTGSGVKVRCSKCAHVFVVRKDPLAAPAGTPGLSFGETGGTTVKVAADALASFAAGSMAPNLNRAPTVPLGPARSIPPPASTQELAAALGFGAAPPRAPVPAFSTHADVPKPPGLPAFPDSTMRELPTFPEGSQQNNSNDRFPESRPLSEVKTEQMKLPAKRDPFHDFGPFPGPPVPGENPFAKVPSSPGDNPFAKIPSAPGREPFAKVPSSPGTYFPPPHPAHDPFPQVPSSVTEPFPKVGSDPSNPFGKIPSDPSNPFSKIPSDPSNPFGKVPSGSQNPFGEISSSGGHNPFLSNDPFAEPPMVPPNVRPESNPFQNPPAPGPDMLQRGIPKVDSKSTFFPPPADFGKPVSNLDNAPIPAPSDHDPFADIDIQVPSPYLEEDNFNQPPPPVPPPKMGVTSEPLARIQFGSAAMPDREVSHAKTAVAAAYRPEEEEERDAPIGAWPTILGVAIGLLIALFVFPGLIGDWMDLRIGTELIQPKKLLPESLDYVSPMGARVTSYQGKNGARMLVVSGSAHNESEQKLDNVQAVVLMLEGDDIVERRRAFVGVPLDEATLASVENAADLEAAYRNAKQSASAEQLEIAPGANARFVVVFPEIPENIETRKFRVEFVKAPIESAKKTDDAR